MSSRLRIFADKNISYVEAAFASLGEVAALPSSSLDARAAKEADILLVRSTVKVGAPLLDGSPVRFVATATIGTDHLDTEYLDAKGIRWASAPGSNAPSVAQWWASAVLTVAAARAGKLAGLVVGVVGCGNVGSRVEKVAAALGCTVLRNDPPRARAEGSAGFVSLEELCARADIVTLHVPLIASGPDRTQHLFDAARFSGMRPGAWLVNASRGAVVDGNALIAARASGQIGAALLDVFDSEPAVSPALVAAADLATPHIAGHSLDGKAAGTEMVYRAACELLGVKPTWNARRSLPLLEAAAIALDARALDDEAAALLLLRRFYGIEQDDTSLRTIAASLPIDAERTKVFQWNRDGYRIRREPKGVSIQMTPPRPRALRLLEALGATIRSD